MSPIQILPYVAPKLNKKTHYKKHLIIVQLLIIVNLPPKLASFLSLRTFQSCNMIFFDRIIGSLTLGTKETVANTFSYMQIKGISMLFTAY